MRKFQYIIIGFFGLGLIDSFIGYAFPIDFEYASYSVIPHFTLIGLLIYVADKSWLNRLLISMTVGLGFDIFYAQTFPLNMFYFALFGLLIGWTRRFMKTERNALLIVLLFVFLYDFIPFVLFHSQLMYPKLTLWFWYLEGPTLIFATIITLFLLYIQQVMSRFFTIRYYREKREAQRKLNRIKMSRK